MMRLARRTGRHGAGRSCNVRRYQSRQVGQARRHQTMRPQARLSCDHHDRVLCAALSPTHPSFQTADCMPGNQHHAGGKHQPGLTPVSEYLSDSLLC